MDIQLGHEDGYELLLKLDFGFSNIFVRYWAFVP